MWHCWIAQGVPCQVMVSGYPSTLYEEAPSGAGAAFEWQVMNQDGVRTEKLWFNFAPERLHWARYAGKNFTDRQRIKRKAQSWGRATRRCRRRAPRGAPGDDGGRGRALGHGDGQQGVAAHRVRRAQGTVRVAVRRGQDAPREPRPRRRPADAVRAADGGVMSTNNPELS